MKYCPNCNSEIPEEYDICWNCNFDLINKKIIEIKDISKEGVIERNITCLRCNVHLEFKGSYKFHEGIRWGVLGDLGHFFTNRESFELYICPACNKIEFFAPSSYCQNE
jgi:hypothetical protein